MNKLFDYYNAIIPEKERWHSVCSQPLVTCLWANTLKISPADLRTSLSEEACDLEPVEWNPVAFRCQVEGMGRRWQYSTGLFQIQEEVSMLPVHFLAVQPGDRVLDLCAAPGNKTAQIAIALNNQGTVVANDKNFQRMRAFGQISKRLGLLNVSTTVHDGRNYPRLPGYFDKVLVDAPCSAEGVFRKGRCKDVDPKPKNSLRLQRAQMALLTKAIQCCRPGGRIVYSTCTFAPEENEAVIDAILKAHDDIKVRPVHLDHFQLSPGITEWQGHVFDDAVKDTVRVWPHLNDTGGFFVAVLEKAGEAPPPGRLVSEAPNEKIQALLNEVRERFEITSDVFQNFCYADDNYRGIYLVNMDNAPPPIDIDATGLFFIKTRINFPKLSTAAAMLFGRFARKNKIGLSAQQRDQYFDQQDVVLSPQQVEACTDTGYVICDYDGYSLGVGLYFEAREDRPPMLRSLFPKYLK